MLRVLGGNLPSLGFEALNAVLEGRKLFLKTRVVGIGFAMGVNGP